MSINEWCDFGSNYGTNSGVDGCFSKYKIQVNNDYDDNLTDFGKAILADRYLYKKNDYTENYQDAFARVAQRYSDNLQHANRLYQYMANFLFMPATPILSNGGTDRGMPISCFLNETSDSLKGIVDLWNENVWLSSKGGGIGSYWGNLRAIGEKVKGSGKTSGIIPFVVVQNALTLAISQGSLRRGSSAVYLPIDHKEASEFINIRKPTGGDPNRKALNIHHGVVITDEFMKAVENGTKIPVIGIHGNPSAEMVSARELWISLLTTRVETGEPYIVFIDSVNRSRPEIYKKLNLAPRMSNLCTEIMLHTGLDHLQKPRTAVCCLASLNLEHYEKWRDNEIFVEDVIRMLDNVLEDFIQNAPDEVQKAKYSAFRERSIGLGVMGWHSLLQSKMIPFESAVAKSLNLSIFKKIKVQADLASKKLALEKGPCPDAAECGIMERFTHKIAVAPTASISIIAGNTSPGIEPFAANVFTQKTLTGSFVVKNKYLTKLLEDKNKNDPAVWSSITMSEGSVQHLDFLNEYEKLVFRTAYEIDQKWIIEHAADRTPYICQSQSVNIFLSSDVHKKYLHAIHMMAWKRGLKSLYYLRSKSAHRAFRIAAQNVFSNNKDDYSDECLSCQ